MEIPAALPARAREVIAQIAATRWASEVYDPEWRLAWVSAELMTLLGVADEAELGIGEHILIARMRPVWSESLTPESVLEVAQRDFPYVAATLPSDVGELTGRLGDSYSGVAEALSEIDPDVRLEAPPLWTLAQDYLSPDVSVARIVRFAMTLREADGSVLGTAMIYGPGLPATVLNLVSRGDPEMFDRMARLVEPGRRPGAVLFADLQASAGLSRRLPSAAYFKLIRAFTTAIDEIVIAGRGIVGKHVGDGVTAFFLAEDAGSEAAAASAAIEAGLAIGGAVERAAAEAGVGEDAAELAVNVGLHWGATLYVGQLITGGRLEVTALGDEVNEAARIQQSARGGAVLASKALIERLAPGDAASLGVDPDSAAYRTVAELPGAGEKAIRDAGGIPVTEL